MRATTDAVGGLRGGGRGERLAQKLLAAREEHHERER